MKKIKFRIYSLLVISLILLTTIVSADNLYELQQKKNELEEKLSNSNQQVEQIQLEITENLKELNDINEKINNYESEINSLDTEVTEMQEQINQAQEKLNLIETDYKSQKRVYEKRIVALYEAGETKYLDVLLSSRSISEFISNYYLISEIAAYDEDILANIEREKNTIDTIETELKEKQKQLKEKRNNKEKTAIILENTKLVRNEYINKLSEQEIETQSQIEVIQEELDRTNKEIEALSIGNLDSTYVGGEFAWPAPGYTTITSQYGMRFHPILKLYKSHSGTDIGAPMGAPVVAANDGVVIKAAYTGGYGNMVMIDHGGGYVTVYGHASELLVKTGQAVKRGDVIMKAGSTGWSTGPHLHFEMRINGVIIDPMPYITKKITPSSNSNTVEENTTNIL